MKNSGRKTDQINKVELMHMESKQWLSNLNFVKDEIAFIVRLLDSYVFEPDTPNLFERLQEYKEQLKKIIATNMRIIEQIGIHDNDLGGMLECKDKECDQAYYHKHEQLKVEVLELRIDFQDFKSDIFSYAGGILKKHKPK